MIKINLLKLFEACNYERNLLVYMLKLHLVEHGIPVVIDPYKVSDKTIDVENGDLSFQYSDCENYLFITYRKLN
ncbi:MAG: hypothetical protein [Caudoviricetes sp.]|nr:MAG: hypothetical protein [Caudoviricetes sp.]